MLGCRPLHLLQVFRIGSLSFARRVHAHTNVAYPGVITW